MVMLSHYDLYLVYSPDYAQFLETVLQLVEYVHCDPFLCPAAPSCDEYYGLETIIGETAVFVMVVLLSPAIFKNDGRNESMEGIY